jgi:hypothetical protein
MMYPIKRPTAAPRVNIGVKTPFGIGVATERAVVKNLTTMKIPKFTPGSG